MTWIVPHPLALPDGPLVGEDRPILEGFLAYQRWTLLNICSGLTAEQIATRAVRPSNLSLLGLLRHMTKVERVWFRERAGAEDVAPMYDRRAAKDSDFEDIVAADAPADYARYVEECELAAAAASRVDFDAEIFVGGDAHSLRVIYVHMIAEYARHNGHADLLREAIDGTRGR